MKKTKLLAISAAICAVIFMFLLSRKKSEQVTQNGNVTSSTSVETTEDSKTILRKIASNGVTRLDEGIAYVLEAYELQDMDLLKERVQQLLEEDLALALAIFSKLDYTFLDYEMKFPHAIVASFLEENYSDPESMELMSPYTETSSILTSIMSVFFMKWFERDHEAQFDWFKENPTFDQASVLLTYAETTGGSDKGYEALHLIDDLPSDDIRKEELIRASMEYMSSENPKLLGDYLNDIETVPPVAYGPIYNMSEQIVTSQAEGNPLEAMNIATEWVSLVSDDTLQPLYLSRIASHLSREYPEEYQQWFDNHQFESEDEKNRFLKSYEEEVEFLRVNGSDTAEQEKLKELNLTEQFQD